jgi:glyoxylase-like metal-dependent hydrolase (beta-lactamase superfamily II)
MHRADLPLLQTLPQQMLLFTGRSVAPAPTPDSFIDEGDTVNLGALHFEVRFTPGHAPGHVIFISHQQKTVFGGDCIFEGSIGRTDLPGGNYAQLMQTIHEKILSLPDDYTIAPGHGGYTTVSDEKNGNPFYLEWLADSARRT